MSKYILLLHEAAPQGASISAEEMQRIIEEYRAWSGRLAEKGHLVGGEKLADGTGRVLRGNGSSLLVTDGPYVEAKEVVGGFFLIEAASYEEAVALAKDCPHLRFGAVEIREVDAV